MSEERYRSFVAYQRILADAYVGVRLDSLDAACGFPLGSWRLRSLRPAPVTPHPKGER